MDIDTLIAQFVALRERGIKRVGLCDDESEEFGLQVVADEQKVFIDNTVEPGTVVEM